MRLKLAQSRDLGEEDREREVLWESRGSVQGRPGWLARREEMNRGKNKGGDKEPSGETEPCQQQKKHYHQEQLMPTGCLHCAWTHSRFSVCFISFNLHINLCPWHYYHLQGAAKDVFCLLKVKKAQQDHTQGPDSVGDKPRLMLWSKTMFCCQRSANLLISYCRPRAL